MGREIIITADDDTYADADPWFGAGAYHKMYLYPNKNPNLRNAADSTAFNLIYNAYSLQCGSGMVIVPYSGHNTLDAKFMGANTNKWLITGKVVSLTGTNDAKEIAVLGVMKKLMKCNKQKITLTMTICGVSVLSNKGGVFGGLTMEAYGQGTGPDWPFTMEIIDLGK